MAAKPYRVMKRPIEVRAMPWSGEASDAIDVINWVLESGGTARFVCDSPNACQMSNEEAPHHTPPHHIEVQTLEGPMKAGPGWWIIRGIEGEFYPCKGEVFSKTYEFLDTASA